MRRQLEDGRFLFADKEEAQAFFEDNKIVGRVIKDIRPFMLDYMIANLCDFEEEVFLEWSAPDGIDTDGQICLLFEDGDLLEIELPGSAPLILGFNTNDLSDYPEYNGKCYSLSTMFAWALGKKITHFTIEENQYGMMFPRYCGIDMSEEGTGISKVVFILDDEIEMTLSGYFDQMQFWINNKGQETNPVRFKTLWDELDLDTKQSLLRYD